MDGLFRIDSMLYRTAVAGTNASVGAYGRGGLGMLEAAVVVGAVVVVLDANDGSVAACDGVDVNVDVDADNASSATFPSLSLFPFMTPLLPV